MRRNRTVWAIALLTMACLGFAGVTHADTAVPLLHHRAGSTSGERGSADGVAGAARFSYPSGISLSADASFALVADAQNNTIRRFDLATGAVSTLAGTAGQRGGSDGVGAAAQFAYPSGVALAADGSFALVADTENHAIRRIDMASGAVTTLAGAAGTPGTADGAGPAARFHSPRGIALAADSSFALVADSDSHTIRRVDVASGAVTTLAGAAGTPGTADGAGPAARFSFPRGIAIAPGGAALVADFSNSTIRRIDLATGAVTTLFGSAGEPGSADGAGTAAQLRFPAGVAAAGDQILIADTYNHSLRGNGGSITVSPQVYLPITTR